jgi:hypothetical protein
MGHNQDKSKKKEKESKEQLNKWLKQDNQEELDAIDFLKMKDNELVLKVPTLKRIERAEYVHFKL